MSVTVRTRKGRDAGTEHIAGTQYLLEQAGLSHSDILTIVQHAFAGTEIEVKIASKEIPDKGTPPTSAKGYKDTAVVSTPGFKVGSILELSTLSKKVLVLFKVVEDEELTTSTKRKGAHMESQSAKRRKKLA